VPRRPRFDAPGVVHHVIQRGVERRTTFLDDADRSDFLRRLDDILPAENVRCLAWVLMTNHFHLVLQTGERPLWKSLHRLGTGYSMRFNRRYERVGHLVQNRFRSRPAQDDEDVKGLIRYVHRNPLRAKLVASLDDLERDSWCGHGAMMGVVRARPFHAVADALAYFGESPASAARDALRSWMLDDDAVVDCGRSPLEQFMAARARVCAEQGVTVADLEAGRRDGDVSRARRVLAALGTREFRLPVRVIAAPLGATPSGVVRAARAAS
jgi:REP element-mobilizing transposase RayT